MMFYRGWGLTDQAREEVLLRFPAVFSQVRCYHVTEDLCKEDAGPPDPANLRAYGYLEFEGYQILAVAVDGQLHQPRRDRMYHVTISHESGTPSSHAGVILLDRQCIIKPVKSFLLPAVPFIRTVGSRPER